MRGKLLLLGLTLTLAACAERAPAPPPPAPAPAPEVPDTTIRFSPVPYAELPGYQADDVSAGFGEFLRSCARLSTLKPDYALGSGAVATRPTDWAATCAAAKAIDAKDNAAVRAFLEASLTPFAISVGPKTDGLFTGYYEPEFEGCLTPAPDCASPLYARPNDLVMVELGEFRANLKGQRIAGTVKGGKLVPYPDRAAIEGGALKARATPLMYLKSTVDNFFLQVQGSGRVKLPDGAVRRVGYAAQNGHPYVTVGKVMKDAGVLSSPVTAPSIRAYLDAHPEETAKWLNANPSYVFFRNLDDVPADQGPIGSLGVPLLAGRSLAVDRTILPLGAPLWLATVTPEPAGDQPFNRLMVAEDTGGAIAGAIRGDIFFGRGADAERLAGLMQGTGKLFVLLPKGTCGDAPCVGTR